MQQCMYQSLHAGGDDLLGDGVSIVNAAFPLASPAGQHVEEVEIEDGLTACSTRISSAIAICVSSVRLHCSSLFQYKIEYS